MNTLSNRIAEKRPWGSFEQFTLNEQTTVKILTLSPEVQFSLQTHANRDEFWRIIGGAGSVTIGEEIKEARNGDEFYAPRGTAHRAKGGPGGMQILEISFGTFDEHDEVRIKDDFNRI